MLVKTKLCLWKMVNVFSKRLKRSGKSHKVYYLILKTLIPNVGRRPNKR